MDQRERWFVGGLFPRSLLGCHWVAAFVPSDTVEHCWREGDVFSCFSWWLVQSLPFLLPLISLYVKTDQNSQSPWCHGQFRRMTNNNIPPSLFPWKKEQRSGILTISRATTRWFVQQKKARKPVTDVNVSALLRDECCAREMAPTNRGCLCASVGWSCTNHHNPWCSHATCECCVWSLPYAAVVLHMHFGKQWAISRSQWTPWDVVLFLFFSPFLHQP